MERIYVDEENLSYAIKALDRAFIDNDLDDGNRIMVAHDDLDAACECICKAGIEYDVI